MSPPTVPSREPAVKPHGGSTTLHERGQRWLDDWREAESRRAWRQVGIPATPAAASGRHTPPPPGGSVPPVRDEAPAAPARPGDTLVFLADDDVPLDLRHVGVLRELLVRLRDAGLDEAPGTPSLYTRIWRVIDERQRAAGRLPLGGNPDLMAEHLALYSVRDLPGSLGDELLAFVEATRRGQAV